MAALAAGRSGARVILADEQPEPGGSLLAEPPDHPGAAWLARVAAELEACPELRVLTRTTAFGYYDHNYLGLLERVRDHLPPGADPHLPRQRLWKVRARQVVLATGALERPLVFAGNDRPGIMLASAVRTYLNRYAVRPGRRAVVFTNNDSAYRTALDLQRAGVGVSVVDLRPNPQSDLPAAARAAGIGIRAGHAITATKGRRRVASVQVQRLSDAGDRVEGAAETIPCDLVCVSGGWNPTIHLHSQSRAAPRYDEERALFLPGEPVQAERAAGACNGAFSLRACLEEGARAGGSGRGGGLCGGAAGAARAGRWRRDARARGVAGALRPVGAPEQDVRRPAERRHGRRHPARARRGLPLDRARQALHHRRHGHRPGQDRNVNALGIVAATTGQAIGAIGVTTFRPPYTPVTFGAIAGRNCGAMFDPVRRTPMHAWHEAHGAVFEDVGQWQRPWYYPRAGEDMAAAVAREVRAVRTGIGILDASTLGKIDLQGPDAAELLDRVYTNAWSQLPVGRCRYGLMLGEDGMVFDDGVTTRLAEHHFLMSTTSGGAARVLAWLEEWLQTEWPELKVFCTSVTEQWATIAISGPDSRRLLAELAEDIDVEPGGLPAHEHARRPRRAACRRACSGSASPASSASRSRCRRAMASRLGGVHRGRRQIRHHAVRHRGDARAARRERLHHRRPGQRRYRDPARSRHGLDRGAERSPTSSASARSRAPTCKSPGASSWSACCPSSRGEVLEEGAQIVADPHQAIPMTMLGHVTSSYMSPTLGRAFALALLQDGRARIGERLYVPMLERTIAVTVTEAVFFDKEGERLRA